MFEMSLVSDLASIEEKIRDKLSKYNSSLRLRVKESLTLLNNYFSMSYANDFIEEAFNCIDSTLLEFFKELAKPVEGEAYGVESLDREEAIKVISEVGVGGLDSSYRRNPDKFLYPFLYITTSSIVTGGNLKPKVVTRSSFYFLDEVFYPDRSELERRIQLEEYVRENELNVLREIVDELSSRGSINVVFFDESFSPFYLVGASKELIKLHNRYLNEKIKTCLRRNVVPVALFETLSRSFSKTLKYLDCFDRGADCRGCSSKSCLERALPDKVLLDHYLSRVLKLPYWRSLTLRFISNPSIEFSEDYGESIVGLYLKLYGGGVVRVELPKSILSREGLIREVHRVIVAASIQGSGYPYVLNKAHELARRRADEAKKRIELMISRISGKIYPYETFTAKSLAKRRRGV